MRKFNLFTLISLSSFSLSQEINEQYLESLPEDIRKDVIERAYEKKDFEKKVFRSIDYSSDIQKKDFDKNLFGADFFDTMQSSFMPINVPNLDDGYILDSGDILNIQLIGQMDSIDSYEISRNGSINIPDIGQLFLSGLSLKEASDMIIANVKQTYIGVDAYVSIKNIRDVSILVSGNAFNPGIYTLSGNSNILHALHAAGGINEFGSYRSINLIRDNRVIDSLDIYDILINGRFVSKTRLRTGDMVFIDPRSNIVTVEGAFNRSSNYELLDGQKLSDVIDYANGITSKADLSNIFLYRLLDGAIKDIPITNISQFKSIEAKDLDRIFIRNHSFRDVQISGSVLRPGSYKLIEGESIFDLIERAGGYTQNAFPEGAIYINKEAEKINRNAIDRLYNEFIDSLLQIMQENGSSEIDLSSLISVANELKNIKPNGRVVVDLKDDNSKYLIRDKDTIFIPEKNSNVFIFGEVSNEGSLIFKQGANIDFYIKEAAGLKETADSGSIFILYPNGRTKQFSRNRNLFATQSQKIDIQPGSVIFVPKKIDNKLSSRITAQAYASILGNIGVTLASISAINNNKW